MSTNILISFFLVFNLLIFNCNFIAPNILIFPKCYISIGVKTYPITKNSKAQILSIKM